LFSRKDFEELKLRDYFNAKEILMDSKANQIFKEGNIFKKIEQEFLNTNILREFE
jgi:hypothetical protein